MPDPRGPVPAETTGPVRPAVSPEDPVDLDGLGPAPLPPPDQSLPGDEDDPWHPPGGADADPPPGDRPEVAIDDSPIDDRAIGDDVDYGGPIGDAGSPGIEWDLVPDDGTFATTESEGLGFTLVDDDPD
jgi:hypothetical protein